MFMFTISVNKTNQKSVPFQPQEVIVCHQAYQTFLTQNLFNEDILINNIVGILIHTLKIKSALSQHFGIESETVHRMFSDDLKQ